MNSKDITIVWNNDNTINKITYRQQILYDVINSSVNGIRRASNGSVILPKELLDIIVSLLNELLLIPTPNQQKRIYFADKIFEHLMSCTNFSDPNFRRHTWQKIMDVVWTWEDQNIRINKGTLYYFMGTTYFESGDIPSAYICFFNALEEDKVNYPIISKRFEDSPAYLTTSLVDNINNNQYDMEVLPLRNWLQAYIDDYNSTTSSYFKLQDMDTKLLQNSSYEDIKRFLVATLREVYHLLPLSSKRMINNDYTKLKFIDILFNIGLIVDQLLEKRFPVNRPKGEKANMATAIFHLALHRGWTNISIHKDAGVFVRSIKPALNNTLPDKTVPDLLDGNVTLDSKTTSKIQSAVFLTYHLRNFAGHNIEGCQVLVNRFDEILSMLFYAFLLTVDVL